MVSDSELYFYLTFVICILLAISILLFIFKLKLVSVWLQIVNNFDAWYIKTLTQIFYKILFVIRWYDWGELPV